MDIPVNRLTEDIGVPQLRISEVLAGKRAKAVTVDTGLRLSCYFGIHDSFWTGLQFGHGESVATDSSAEALEKIAPVPLA